MLRLPRLTTLYPSAFFYWLWTFTLGVLTARGRWRIALLGLEAPWFRSPLPQAPLNQVIGQARELTLYEISGEPGNTTLLEQIVLARVAERRQPRAIFEFGTFDGRSAINLISHAAPEAHLYTLDLPVGGTTDLKLEVMPGERAFIDKPERAARLVGSVYAPRIERLYGDSATFDFSPYHGKIDLVFIDASHAYGYVRSDTLNALKLLRPEGGVLLWHDYSNDWPGVIKALNEFYRSGEAPFGALTRVEGTTIVMLEVGPGAR